MNNFIPLESIRIANPCSADWNKMQGNDRARFCQSCEKNVYNLSDMTRAAAENLVREKEGNVCVRFYRRADGTVLTDDCPVGLRPARRGAVWMARAALAGIAAFAALVAGAAHAARVGNEGESGGENTNVPEQYARPLRERLPFQKLQNVQPVKAMLDAVLPSDERAIAGGISAPVAPQPQPAPEPAPEIGEVQIDEVARAY